MSKGTITSLLVILAAVTCMASADITLEVVPVDNSSQLTGFITQDLVVTTDTDWEQAFMIVTLDEPGGIYQDPLGNVNPQSPNPAFFPIAPSLEFDTYVSNGVLGESVAAFGTVTFDPLILDEDHIFISWFTDGTDDIGTLALARVTLAETAHGTWLFTATAASENDPTVDVPAGVVVNGEMFIPEPATLSLLTLGGLALMRRKRK